MASAPADVRRVVSSKTSESLELASDSFDFFEERLCRRCFDLEGLRLVDCGEAGADCCGDGSCSKEVCDGDEIREPTVELSEGSSTMNCGDRRLGGGVESSVHCERVSGEGVKESVVRLRGAVDVVRDSGEGSFPGVVTESMFLSESKFSRSRRSGWLGKPLESAFRGGRLFVSRGRSGMHSSQAILTSILSMVSGMWKWGLRRCE